MRVTRREFLQLSGSTIGALLLAQKGTGLLFADEIYYPGKEVVPDRWEKGICRLCGTGCGVEVGIKGGKAVAIRGNKDYPVNLGTLCLKGLTLLDVVYSKERALNPYLRKDDKFIKISMDEALNKAALKISETVKKHGPNSVALYVGAQVFTEEMFVANKLFKGLIGTNNVESNARLCMASAVTGFLTTFGLDEPPAGYGDIEKSDCFFIIGSNAAECHPIIFARILKRRSQDPNVKIIVADPRFTPTAAHADIWLPFYPGYDLALMNAMAYVIFEQGLADLEFIKNHINFSEGGAVWGELKNLELDQFKDFLKSYTPEKVSEQIGIEKEKIIEAAKVFAAIGKNTMSLWTMGLNQRTQGTWANNLVYNLHFITGKICKPGSGALSLTGQPNACGGVREQGMLSHILPGHRKVANAIDRQEMEEVWGIKPGSISASPGKHTVAMFDALGDDIKLIWIICSNPAQTLPHLNKVFSKFKNAYIIVQDVFGPPQTQGKQAFRHITAELADLFLPSAFWIEKGGVFGNTERRSSLTEKMIDPPNSLLADWEIVVEVARRMGYEKEYAHYTDTEAIWDEYISCTKGKDIDLSPANYDYLRKKGSVQWPIISQEEGGTDYRYLYPRDKFLNQLIRKGEQKKPKDGIVFYGKPDGRATCYARHQEPPGEVPDSEYPIFLTTGRVVHHWHSGTMTMQSAWLKKMVEKAYVEVNIDDAAKHGIKHNDLVNINSRRGSIKLTARVYDPKKYTTGLEERMSVPRPGIIFVPFYDPNKLINLLCNDKVDPLSKEPEYKICAVNIAKV